MKRRVICLVDCDAFFVSCEQLDNPSLRGKPVCVTTGLGERGIIVSRSHEAKALGIKMGEPLFKVAERGIKGVFLPARHRRYTEISKQVMSVLQNFSPDVEQVSIDEAYVDLTGLDLVYKKSYASLITQIRQQILQDIGIPVSIGMSSSKTLAKLASDKAKQSGGIFIILPEQIIQTIGSIPISDVCGIGKKHNQQLSFLGIFSIQDYILQEDCLLRKAFGINGLNLKYELLGYCVSNVSRTPQPPKSIQDTSVLNYFTTDIASLRPALLEHIHHACHRLRYWNGFCGTIGVMLRTKDFQIVYAKHKLPFVTNSEKDIATAGLKLLNDLYKKNIHYRSTGISLEDICYEKQSSLFEQIETCHDSKLGHAIDELEKKFGPDIVKTGWI